MSKNVEGYVLGVVSAICYGLNPFFAIPLYADGMGIDSVLLFRYMVSTAIIALIMRRKCISFSVKRNEIVPLLAMGLLMSLSSLCLFESYKHIAVGIASTLLFVYPAMVAIINTVVFKEKISILVVISILVAGLGIFLLSWVPSTGLLSVIGIIMVILSALSYAIYLVGINRSSIKTFPIIKLTFYVLLFGTILFLARVATVSELQLPTRAMSWVNIGGLAVFPTVVSLTAMSLSVRYIGSTITAILGALEPLTGVLVGVLAFSEHLTPRIVAGIALVIVAITVIVTEKPLRSVFNRWK